MALNNIQTRPGGLQIDLDNSNNVLTPSTNILALAQSLSWWQYHWQKAVLTNYLNSGDHLRGDDQINGGSGNDTMGGGAGNDILNTGSGNNLADGGEGNDTINGGTGNDTLIGGVGNDLINDNGGTNTIYGDGGPGSGTELLSNGGFEFPQSPVPGSGYTSDPSIPGWTSLNGENFERVAASHGRGAAAQGTYWLDLDETAGNLDIVSNAVGIQYGETYRVAFSLNDSHGAADNGVAVYLGNQLIDTITAAEVMNGGGFQSFEYFVTAEFSGNAGLRFVGLGNPDNIGLGLDAVSLQSLDSNAGDGNDTINAGNNDDRIVAGGGNDVVNANQGNNTVYAGAGNDTVTGGSGNDAVYASAGNDTVYANEGNNQVDGGAGNDTIYSGSGSDNISDGEGNDIVYAGEGDDNIMIGLDESTNINESGSDTYYGQGGADDFYIVSPFFGNDTIWNFSVASGDRLVADGSDWDDPGNLGALNGGALTLTRAQQDLTITFNNGGGSTLNLKYFFSENNQFANAVDQGTLSDAEAVPVLLAIFRNGNPNEAAFLI